MTSMMDDITKDKQLNEVLDDLAKKMDTGGDVSPDLAKTLEKLAGNIKQLDVRSLPEL